MAVKRHAKKITELEEKILEEGEMNSRQIHDWMNARISRGVTMPWVTNMLGKSGYFVKTGTEMIGGFTGNYRVTLWDSKRRSQND